MMNVDEGCTNHRYHLIVGLNIHHESFLSVPLEEEGGSIIMEVVSYLEDEAGKVEDNPSMRDHVDLVL